MTTAVFIDDDGRFTYAAHGREYDLGHAQPGRYIYAGTERQLCEGGGFMGATLMWPGGKILGWEDGVSRMKTPIKIPVYDDLPDHETLAWLGRQCGAKTYKSRKSYERHFRAEAV